MPGRLKILSAQQARAEIEGRHAADAQLARRRARRLCENIDEGIGRAAAALSRGGADHARLILGVVREAVIEIADGLGSPVDAAVARRVGRAGVRGAAAAHLALRAQDLLEQLDVQLKAAVGDRTAERLARNQALTLLTVVNELATVAAGSRPGRESHPHRHSAGRRQTAGRAPATAGSSRSGPH
jgi:hypothetical protein